MQRDFGKSCKHAHLNQILPPHLVPIIILVHGPKFIESYCDLNSSFLYLVSISGKCSSTTNNLQSTTIHGLDSYTGIVKGNYWQLEGTSSHGMLNGIPTLVCTKQKCLLTLLLTATVLSNYDSHENTKSSK